MKRFEVLRSVLEHAPSALIVSNLGPVSQELYAIRDAPQNFYMLGSMGLASSVGLGVALNTPREVVVIDGDGSVLMNLGTFATIAACAPANLVHLVIDNEVHESTGGQRTHTACGTDLAAIACAAAIRSVHSVDTRRSLGSTEFEETFAAALGTPGPHVVVVKVEPGGIPIEPVPLDSHAIADRFSANVRQPQSAMHPAVGADDFYRRIASDLANAGVGFACSVPCKLLAPLLPALDANAAIRHVPVTREEEGVGICGGAALAGRLPMLAMQNSGLGNCINALLSLTSYYGLPLLLLIGHRGTEGERIAAQKPMGERTRALLDAASIKTFEIKERADFERLPAIVDSARDACAPVAALVAPSALQ